MRKAGALLLLMTSMAYGQEFSKLEHLAKHLNADEKVERSGIQIHQFLDHCIYEHQCGKFSGGAFREFGVIKGFMLTIDRRLRCNQLTKSRVLPIRVNAQGKIKDHWIDYRVKTK